MERQRKSLDGFWQFLHDRYSTLRVEDLSLPHHLWRPIHIPSPWQAQFDDLRESTGTGWHRLHFRQPEGWEHAGASFVLHFGAVFWHAQVWLNGVYLGEDEGGYFPFEFSVGHVLRDDNELLVRVTTPADDPQQYPEYPFGEILHGKQSWYGHWGGIWQSVWLERRAATYIEHLHVVPDVSSRSVALRVEMNTDEVLQSFSVRLLDPDGQVVAHEQGQVHGKVGSQTLILDDAPLLWSPNVPHLYCVQVELEHGDSLEKTCGFRTIETRDGKVWLNGEPFYMRGALDQDYYPDTLSTLPDDTFIEDQMRKAKAMGLNTLRNHIKIADPRYYETADRLGLLLWVDLPNWTRLTARVKERVRMAFRRLLRREHHRPSIAIWTIVNEDWGTDLVNNAGHRAWLRETFAWAKAQDPTRLVVDNSPCVPNFHVHSDLDDYHYYRAIPDHAHEWDAFVASFANRTYPSYSPNGDSTRSTDEPLIVSEFGNWGLPDPAALRDEEGCDPWWFSTGQDWGEGIVHPAGIERRFQQWHFDQVFGSLDTLVEAAQGQQFRALKYQIESMRMQAAIQGYVITELTDLHWEANGLLDMRRNPRSFHKALAHVNADALVIPRTRQGAIFGGGSLQVDLWLTATRECDVHLIRWHMPQHPTYTGEISVRSTMTAGVHSLKPLHLNVPAVEKPQLVQVVFELFTGQADEMVSRNTLDLLLLPPLEAVQGAFYAPDARTGDMLSAAGITVSRNERQFPWVTTYADDPLRQHTARGRQSLLLANEDSGLRTYQSGVVIEQEFPYVTLSPRAGTIWAGDWVSSFGWLRSTGIFADLPSTTPMHAGGAALIPEHVLLGATQDDYGASVYSGLFVGWVQRPAATVVRRMYGTGTCWVTTLPFLRFAAEGDALGQTVLRRFLRSLQPASTENAPDISRDATSSGG